MADSPLRNAIDFLNDFGFYDVILPFLLVFTVVFAALEKTKIFGVEGKDKAPKQNINAMIAFVIALFFVAAKELVAGVQTMLPVVAVILIALMSFMMLMGFLFSDKEFNFEDHKAWTVVLSIILFISLGLLLMYTFWRESWDWLIDVDGTFLTSTGGVSLIFLLVVLGTIMYVTYGKNSGGE